MSTQSFANQIVRYRVVPIIVIENPASALFLADALMEGGLPIIEITLRTRAAIAVIRQLVEERPQMLVGAGTVLTVTELEAAKAAGAAFAVAPGLNPTVVQRARQLDIPFIPGVATPTEIEVGMALGCDLLKFFPVEALGGTSTLAAISAPYKHTSLRLMPAGGITISNLEKYLKISTVGAVGGSWIADQESVATGQWSAIRDRCKEAMAVVKNLAK